VLIHFVGGQDSWVLFDTEVNGKVHAFLSDTPRTGFETKLKADRYAEYVVVQGLSAEGEVLGVSKVTTTVVREGSYADDDLVDEDEEEEMSGEETDEMDEENESGADEDDFDTACERLGEDLSTAFHATIRILTNPITEISIGSVAGLVAVIGVFVWMQKRGFGSLLGRGKYSLLSHPESEEDV
jgi:hypothetical protein